MKAKASKPAPSAPSKPQAKVIQFKRPEASAVSVDPFLDDTRRVIVDQWIIDAMNLHFQLLGKYISHLNEMSVPTSLKEVRA